VPRAAVRYSGNLVGPRPFAFLFVLALGLSVSAVPPVVRNPPPVLISPDTEILLKANVTGDAADDLILIGSNKRIEVRPNAAAMPFGGPITTPITDAVSAAAVGHLDADAFLDIVVVVPWEKVAIYHGAGDGTFLRGALTQTSPGAAGVAVGDVNGDGADDVVVCSTHSTYVATVHFGGRNGTLGSGISTSLSTGGASEIEIVDLNGDGKADIILRDSWSINLALGSPSGTFDHVWSHWGSNAGVVRDFDGDGKADLFAAIDRYGTFEFRRGTGDGRFLSPVAHRVAERVRTGAARAVDFDGDGKLDLVAASETGGVVVVRGNGDGTFHAAVRWWTDSVLAIHVDDFDRDGEMDVFYREGYEGGRHLFLRGVDGGKLDAYRAHWVASNVAEPRKAWATAACDMNGDGLQDVVVLTSDEYSARELAVLLNTGGGSFASPVFTEIWNDTDRAMATGDLNGDGYGDVIGQKAVRLGRGDGGFQEPMTFLFSGTPRLAHLNADTNLDLVVSHSETSTIYQGLGNGTFTEIVEVAMVVGGLADFNGDGRADLAGSQGKHSSGAVRVGLNNGTFGFTISDADPTSYTTFLAAGDFNNDGRSDLAVALYAATRVIPGRGDGTFGNAVNYTRETWFDWGASAGDLNADGALDLVTGSQLYLGDGAGRFPSYAHVLSGWATQSAIADFDGDGDLDLIVTNSEGPAVALVQPNAGPDPVVTPTLTVIPTRSEPLYGQAVEYTAILAPASVRRNGGAFTFYVDGVAVETIRVNDDATAKFNTSWPTGAHSLTVKYTGDSHHLAVSHTVHLDVPRNRTTLIVNEVRRDCASEIFVVAAAYGDTSYGLPGPQGDLVFRKGTTVLPSRRSTFGYYLVSGLGVGTHTITAEYAGDANYEASAATFQQIIDPSIAPFILAGNAMAGEPGNVARGFGGGLSGGTYTWTVTNGTIDSGQGTLRISYTAGSSGEVTLQLKVTRPDSLCEGTVTISVPVLQRQPGAAMLYVVTPCRVLDTRGTAPIEASGRRDVAVGGSCGVPADAKSVVGNVTVISPPGTGWMTLFAYGAPWPGTSSVSYRAGRTRANQTIVPLSPDGRMTVLNAGSPVHFAFDVTAYFR
jgi:hypothetical protein